MGERLHPCKKEGIKDMLIIKYERLDFLIVGYIRKIRKNTHTKEKP